ncbi:hypothetical protein M378DRAFT_167867 [Amanita muscaria Koide BX008]|uniref:Smr domain-containing protein n=1 Tax=Amanita muscaria (strain Koide BX008) TaxID=946122 RepID=A0A0C2WWB1_AMAMK|nr:hypothetical protein M378DRAFT_167867 [Amanita muscaria Koide BX008]
MGNSQSASQAAADAYDSIHKQHGQSSINNYPNEHRPGSYNQSSNNNHGVYRVVQEEHDDPEYTRLRALAHEEAQKRNACFEASQAAYGNREGARAKELSNEGKEHSRLMEQYNERAANFIFRHKNAHRPPTEIDLHGLFVKEASQKVEEAIQRCQQMKLDHLVIIVGKGLHSPGQRAKLKPAIVELVNKYQVAVEPDKPNPGCLYVEFGKGPSDLSWLDRWFSSAKDTCILM